MFYPDSKTKLVTHNYAAQPSGRCGSKQGIASAAECFATAQELGVYGKAFVNKTVSDAAQPAGCTVTTTSDGSSTVVTYNSAGSMPCANSTLHKGQATTAVGTTIAVELQSSGEHSATMVRSPKGQWCSHHRQGVLSSFKAKSPSLADMAAALAQCEAFCLTSAACTACSVDNLSGSSALNVQFSAIPSCGPINKWGGAIAGDVSSNPNPTPNPNRAIAGDVSSKTLSSDGNATITLVGPADAWFAVGLDAQDMSDAPYTLVVNSTAVWEQKIGTCGSEAEHCPGDTLEPSITVVSNSVVHNVRTVMLTRSFKGLSPKHYTFTPQSKSTMHFISAVGSTQAFGYHKMHDEGTISFTAPGVPACICDEGAQGQLCETNGAACGSFTKDCLTHQQGGDLFAQHNPTCDSLQYAGGLKCCSHKRILLDADQEVRPELLRYREFPPPNHAVDHRVHVLTGTLVLQT